MKKECKIAGCTKKHKGLGYCLSHWSKFRRGTLDNYPQSKLCSVSGCMSRSYCHNKYIKHYQRAKDGLPENLSYASKDEYQRGNLDFEHKSSDMWSLSVRRYYDDKCQICGWDKDSCDVHHIVAKSKGGKNTLLNGIVLCPNDHRLANRGKILDKELVNYK
jgi:5-methylcytosine-specific restriction endonuclease McrA